MNCNAHNLSSRNQDNQFEQLKDKQLKLQLNANNFVTAKLESNKKFNVLIDSGSSKTLVSENFINSTSHFNNCDRTVVEPIFFKVGILRSEEKICFDMYVQNVKICLHAYIVKTLIGVELVLGNDVLVELGGNLDFESRIVKLKDKTIDLTPVRRYVIQPGQRSHVVLKGKFPKLVKNSEFVVATKEKLKILTASSLLVRAKGGTVVMPVINRTGNAVFLRRV